MNVGSVASRREKTFLAKEHFLERGNLNYLSFANRRKDILLQDVSLLPIVSKGEGVFV